MVVLHVSSLLETNDQEEEERAGPVIAETGKKRRRDG